MSNMPREDAAACRGAVAIMGSFAGSSAAIGVMTAPYAIPALAGVALWFTGCAIIGDKLGDAMREKPSCGNGYFD